MGDRQKPKTLIVHLNQLEKFKSTRVHGHKSVLKKSESLLRDQSRLKLHRDSSVELVGPTETFKSGHAINVTKRLKKTYPLNPLEAISGSDKMFVWAKNKNNKKTFQHVQEFMSFSFSFSVLCLCP